jgi:hypothetical protein
MGLNPFLSREKNVLSSKVLQEAKGAGRQRVLRSKV